MDLQSSSQKTTEQAVGQAQEDQEALLDILIPEPEFKKPEEESTPHDTVPGALTGEMEPFPVSGGEECADRAHVEELPMPSEGTFTAQESGVDKTLPPWLNARHSVEYCTNSKGSAQDELSYTQEVTEECKDILKQFPKALGLIVLFACTVAASFRKLPPVPGVVKGVDKMIATFRHLGHAVLRLPVNLASWQYRAAMKAVASLSFPESYRRMFVYYTGHGGNDSIDTPDGNLQLVDITNPYSPMEAPRLKHLTKVFIFDTCSSLSKLDSIFPNSVLLFPALPTYPAFAKPDGCGLLTQHLAPALRTSSESFGEVVIHVTDTMTKEIKENPLWHDQVSSDSQPLYFQTLQARVSLLNERLEAMTPSIIIQKIWPTSISVVISSPPSSVHFHLHQLLLFYKRVEAQQWTQVEFNNVLGGTVVIHNLSHGKRYILKAVAVYPDDKKIGSPEMPCDMPTEVEPVLLQDLEYCHVDSVEFEVFQPAKKDTMRWFEVVCQCDQTQETKSIEWPENLNERVRIGKLEPGVQYTVTATAHYPNEERVNATESFEIPKLDVTPKIVHSESQPPTHDSVTVSVTAPPQAEKYHLENLSAKLWRKNEEELWQSNEGELQSQTIQMDQGKESITFRKLSSSTAYVVKAIATYRPNMYKVVSSDLEMTTLKFPYCKILLRILAFLFFVFSIAFIIALLPFLIRFQPIHVSSTPKPGLQGDTIVVSEFNSFGLASVNITGCPEKGDNSHTLKAALVRKSDVVTYMANNTDTINGSSTWRVKLLYDIYFLQDSVMAVNICLSSQYSPSGSSGSVVAFVFDSLDENKKFLQNKTNGIDSSRYHKALQVGSTSRPICTWVNYTVASPAYYYLSLGEYTLETLAFSADLHLHEIYLNFSDYEGSEQYCSSVSEKQPCTFELHDSLKQKEYVLVSYICSRPEWFSPSTHACAKFKKNFSLEVIVPVTLGIGTILCIMFTSVVTVVLCKCTQTPKKHVRNASSEELLPLIEHSA